MTAVIFNMVGPRKVRATRLAVALFNAQWPCSPLRDSRAYWWEFDEDGNMTDTDCPEHDDGPAALALAEDAQTWMDSGELPAWAGVAQ